MNDNKVKQLALQAGMATTSLHYGRKDPYVLWENDIEKFAELIISECFTALSPYIDDPFTAVEAELRQHFGVD